jgi:hypothetical protein
MVHIQCGESKGNIYFVSEMYISVGFYLYRKCSSAGNEESFVSLHVWLEKTVLLLVVVVVVVCLPPRDMAHKKISQFTREEIE